MGNAHPTTRRALAADSLPAPLPYSPATSSSAGVAGQIGGAMEMFGGHLVHVGSSADFDTEVMRCTNWRELDPDYPGWQLGYAPAGRFVQSTGTITFYGWDRLASVGGNAWYPTDIEFKGLSLDRVTYPSEELNQADMPLAGQWLHHGDAWNLSWSDGHVTFQPDDGIIRAEIIAFPPASSANNYVRSMENLEKAGNR